MMKNWSLAALLLASVTSVAACTDQDAEDAAKRAAAFEPYACGAAEVHVFGIADAQLTAPSGNAAPETPTATVTLDRAGMHYIVLTAREATHWKVVAANADVEIDGIYTMSPVHQTVDAPAGVPVYDATSDADPTANGCAIGDGCSDANLNQFISRQFGTAENSRHVCNRASSFTLKSDMTASSDCIDLSSWSESRACVAPSSDGDDGDGPVLGCGGPPPPV